MIIGFAGKAASGKTTAARHLQSCLDGEALIVPMAMVLRDEVEDFLRLVGADPFLPLVHGSQEDKVRVFHVDAVRAQAACRQWTHFMEEHRDIQERSGMTSVTVRRLLQWWGTEYRRAQDPDYWTKAWGRKIEQYDLTRTPILVDDVRFMNELEVIRTHGGLIVKIERPGFSGANNHSSETSLDGFNNWDAVVVNNGTLEEFRAKIGTLDKLLKNDRVDIWQSPSVK
ncbi:MAG: hypothetical protein NDI73_02105 [Desulfuromonadales bacterium]|nr:hypothetical protein [Desulfuromonadales bacterium]